MYKTLLLLCLVGVFCTQDNGDPNSIMEYIFGKPPMNTPETLNNVERPTTIVPSISQPQDSEDQPCTTRDGTGRCVRYFNCDNNNTAIDRDGIIDINVQTNKFNSYQDVCCNIPDVIQPDNPITPRPDTSKQIGMPHDNGDTVSLIEFIFGKPPQPTRATPNNAQKPATIIPPVSQYQDSEEQTCTTYDGNEGRCMHYFLCDTNNTGIDGDGIINMGVQTNKCNSYQDVCCNIPDVIQSDNPITPRPDTSKQIGMGPENGDLFSIIETLFGRPAQTTRTTLNDTQKAATTVPPVSHHQDSEDQTCTTDDGNEGRCMHYFLCDTNNTGIDGDGIINMRKIDQGSYVSPVRSQGNSVQANKCNSYQYVCCNIPNVIKRDNPITPRPDTSIKQIGMVQGNGDPDSIIEFIFGKPPMPASLNNAQNPETTVPPLSQPQDSEDQPCTTHDGNEGRCMHYFLCDTNNTGIDGDGIINKSVQTNKCNSYQDVCCNIPDVIQSDNPITPRPDTAKQIGMAHENGDLDSIIEFIFGKPLVPIMNKNEAQ